MAQRGQHEISGSGKPSDEDAGAFAGWVVVVIAIIAIVRCSMGPVYSSDPPLPTGRQAVFSGVDSGSAALLQVIIGGGSYQISYETTDGVNPLLQNQPAGTRLFTADFSTGKTTGNARSANVLVLFGDVQLKVAPIAKYDQMTAEFIESKSDGSKAYFNYAQSERGPPSFRGDPKRVFIVGSLVQTELGDAFDNSSREIRILDLGPGAEAWASWDTEAAKWHEEQRAQAAEDKRNREAREHTGVREGR